MEFVRFILALVFAIVLMALFLANGVLIAADLNDIDLGQVTRSYRDHENARHLSYVTLPVLFVLMVFFLLRARRHRELSSEQGAGESTTPLLQ